MTGDYYSDNNYSDPTAGNAPAASQNWWEGPPPPAIRVSGPHHCKPASNMGPRQAVSRAGRRISPDRTASRLRPRFLRTSPEPCHPPTVRQMRWAINTPTVRHQRRPQRRDWCAGGGGGSAVIWARAHQSQLLRAIYRHTAWIRVSDTALVADASAGLRGTKPLGRGECPRLSVRPPARGTGAPAVQSRTRASPHWWHAERYPRLRTERRHAELQQRLQPSGEHVSDELLVPIRAQLLQYQTQAANAQHVADATNTYNQTPTRRPRTFFTTTRELHSLNICLWLS